MKRVLIVDDNVDIARLLSVFASRLGHEVQVAHDGPTALQMADDFLPEVILLDIGLPGMSGYDVARKLRSTPREPLKLVALTGFGPEESGSNEAGFDHHLTKPVQLADLQAALS